MVEMSEADVQAARDRYRASVKTLKESRVQAEVIAHFERYLDVEENRAKLLQDLVRPAMLAIKGFEMEALQLETQIAVINSAITALGTGILADQFAAFQPSGPVPGEIPMETLRRSMAELSRIREESERNKARIEALNWELVMVRSYAVAQAVVDMRTAGLRSFAAHSLRLTIEDYAEAAAETAKEQLFEAVEKAADEMIRLASDPENLKVFGEATADLVGHSVGPIWVAGKLAYQLVKQAREIKTVYEGRGQIDELFDFIELIHQTEALNKTQLALLQAQADVYETQLSKGARPH